MSGLHPDVLRLIFDECDGVALCSIGLTCHAWRSLSLPSLFRSVDLSCHNIGEETVPAKDGGYYGDNEEPRYMNGRLVFTNSIASRLRPANFVNRQRAFLRAITSNPELATLVKSLTWTLVWKDFADTSLAEIDYQTWNIFSQLKKVTKLDLASVHDIHYDDIVRQNPSQLFPAVTDLRLVGRMHRGLVRAILASLDTTRLRSLKLDYLQDEGAHPDESTMSSVFPRVYNANLYKERPDAEDPTVISQALLDRQESGKAFIFPGSMWLPLIILSTTRLNSLTQLRVDIPPLSGYVHLQNYHTMFQKTADTIKAASASLRFLVIIIGDARTYPDYASKAYGRRRQRMSRAYNAWRLEMASSYLYQLVTVLSESPFPKLDEVRFEGFGGLETGAAGGTLETHVGRTLEAIRKCPFAATASFTKLPSRIERPVFNGYVSKNSPEEYEKENGWDLQDVLDASF